MATITPRSYISNPDFHDPKTLDLIRNELVYQVDPREAERTLGRNFEQFFSLQSPHEIDRRRADFKMGLVVRIHVDKLFIYESGLYSLMDLGLAQREGHHWAVVERSSAAEFMAALALSLCQAAGPGGWHRGEMPESERWVPVTDDPAANRALLSGLTPAMEGEAASLVRMRVSGELENVEVRSVVLADLLPVPDEPMSVQEILSFRRRHGGLLPAFRRELEKRVQEIREKDSPNQQLIALDQLRDEVEELTAAASAYLAESGARRVVRSPLVSFFKFLPGLKDPIDNAQDLLSGGNRSANILHNPLAYLAFANSAFAPIVRYRIDPFTGRPLLTSISD